MTITEFLLARIAEDEQRGCLCGCFEGPTDECDQRVRRESEAKRRIVENPPASPDGRDEWESCCETLASVYADHPDYRQEWA